MTNPAISPALLVARQQLARAVSNFSVPPPQPFDVSPWVAMSALQKAVRRGNEDVALRAVATLLARAPESLWRRCGGIAYEDVGLADVDTQALVTAALAGKRFRATVGGEWMVAASIVTRMTRAQKCRAADDLLMTAELHPDCARARREYAAIPTADLLRIVAAPGPLLKRAVALLYAVGTGWRTSRHLHPRRGDPRAVFGMLGQQSVATDLAEIAREGFRKLGEGLCPLVVLLSPLLHAEHTAVEDDAFPPEMMVDGVPGWAYDIYSREGRTALQAFLQQPTETASWIRARIPEGKRVAFLGGIVFRVEGGLVKGRLRWPTGDALRSLVDFGSHGLDYADAGKALELMRQDIPVLNAVRSDVC
jgi:hypothetical protein